jgi:hypothetical protein
MFSLSLCLFFSELQLGTNLNTSCADYSTFIAKTPRNLNIYGMGEKGCRVALRLEDGSEITGENGFNGTWGAIIGRYTPEDDAPPEQDALLQLSQS